MADAKAEPKTVRLVHRFTGSVAVVPEDKAAALKTLGYAPEPSKRTAKSDK